MLLIFLQLNESSKNYIGMKIYLMKIKNIIFLKKLKQIKKLFLFRNPKYPIKTQEIYTGKIMRYQF